MTLATTNIPLPKKRRKKKKANIHHHARCIYEKCHRYAMPCHAFTSDSKTTPRPKTKRKGKTKTTFLSRRQNLTTYNAHLLHRPIRFARLHATHPLHDVHPVNDMSENGVSAVQMPRGRERDEELTA